MLTSGYKMEDWKTVEAHPIVDTDLKEQCRGGVTLKINISQSDISIHY